MIQELSLPEYYLESVDVDVSPRIGERVIGVVGTNLELENPSIIQDPTGFQCSGTLLLQLYEKGKAPWEVEDSSQTLEFGTVETEFVIYISGDESTLLNYTQEWIEMGEYDLANPDFKTHLESGILQYVIDPIGKLLETSYSGIVPRITFPSGEESKYKKEY